MARDKNWLKLSFQSLSHHRGVVAGPKRWKRRGRINHGWLIKLLGPTCGRSPASHPPLLQLITLLRKLVIKKQILINNPRSEYDTMKGEEEEEEEFVLWGYWLCLVESCGQGAPSCRQVTGDFYRLISIKIPTAKYTFYGSWTTTPST